MIIFSILPLLLLLHLSHPIIHNRYLIYTHNSIFVIVKLIMITRSNSGNFHYLPSCPWCMFSLVAFGGQCLELSSVSVDGIFCQLKSTTLKKWILQKEIQKWQQIDENCPLLLVRQMANEIMMRHHFISMRERQPALIMCSVKGTVLRLKEWTTT